jgi:crossover junction endodeoxyribonuclease RuvC
MISHWPVTPVPGAGSSDTTSREPIDALTLPPDTASPAWPRIGCVLAIDPGLSGAYALLTAATTVIADLPTCQAQHGQRGKVRAELDLHGLRHRLSAHRIDHCFLERVAARPGQGTVSMFRFGEAAGGIYGLLVGVGLPVTFIAPRDWQKFHGIGPSPDAARQRAVQLYPAMADRLTRPRDANRADALLIANFGWHVMAKPAVVTHMDQHHHAHGKDAGAATG